MVSSLISTRSRHLRLREKGYTIKGSPFFRGFEGNNIGGLSRHQPPSACGIMKVLPRVSYLGHGRNTARFEMTCTIRYTISIVFPLLT